MSGQRCDVAGYAPSKIFGSLFLAVATLFLFSESVSLKGKQVIFMGLKNKYVSLANWSVPELCEFTVCVDLNKTEKTVESGTAFSYDISSNSTNIREVELALSFHNSTLRMLFLGSFINLGEYIGAYKMHQICCVWDSQKHLLELFCDGKKLVNQSLPEFHFRCLRPNGTLVIGHLHKNYNGEPIRQSSFVGIVHYFQMWNGVIAQQDLELCRDGNVVSWGQNYWFLKDARTESAQHQRCGVEEAPSAFPPITSPDSNVTGITDTFYSFHMNFSVTWEPPRMCDRYDAKKLSETWRSSEWKNGEWLSRRYSSKAIIRARSSQSTQEITRKLQNTLHGDDTEDQLSMSVKQKDTHPDTCSEQTVQSNYKGTYTWRKTAPPNLMSLPCEANHEFAASRLCWINLRTEKAYWKRSNLTACLLLQNLPDNILDLKNVTVTVENAEEVADHILFLLNFSELNKNKIEVLMSKLTDIANSEEISLALADKTLQIINILLEDKNQEQDMRTMLNRILTLMEEIGFKMTFSGRNESVTLPKLALTVLRPDPMNFQGVAFGIVCYDLEISPQDDSLKNEVLNTFVVGASIENKTIEDLEEPVSIVLEHRSPHGVETMLLCTASFGTSVGMVSTEDSKDESLRDGEQHLHLHLNISKTKEIVLDIWRKRAEPAPLYIEWSCDLSRTPLSDADEWALTLVTYVGCGISSIFLGLALLVYFSTDKVREDYPSKILVNLCFALLMLNLAFLVNSWLAMFQNRGLCITVAVTLHYFLLSAFTWMGLEAVNMYFALVKVFKVYIPYYMLKFSIAGWGIPALIVIVVLSINRDFYGTEYTLRRSADGPSMQFCWIQDNWVSYISLVGYFILVFLINISMFVTVLCQIRVMKTNNPRGRKDQSQEFLLDLKRVISLTFLLGLTWGFAFFAWDPLKTVFMYVFAICNSLQGFFIFVFYCLMKDNVRKQCQIHFCCGKFRLSNFQRISSATVLGNLPSIVEQKHSCHSLKSLKTCTTGCSVSNGSDSFPEASPDIGVETDHVASCSNSHMSSASQAVQLPRARRISSGKVDLHHTEKNKDLS
ncbi:adhesion G-protein coupled receptor G4 [Ahaetulla prasina]|uniref:adhesion G-protein coupled receptor G4 n=1 Tax=Ahaetulla prasina TaxID=499056 RepID=UPI002648C35D|nr:adhesion G-protein coupled receptor G4 [Ahaetulla prasina]